MVKIMLVLNFCNSQVVSKWKKHKKDVDRQMQQMNKSYQDQLLEVTHTHQLHCSSELSSS